MAYNTARLWTRPSISHNKRIYNRLTQPQVSATVAPQKRPQEGTSRRIGRPPHHGPVGRELGVLSVVAHARRGSRHPRMTHGLLVVTSTLRVGL